jgi:hypothetical protein
VHLACSMPDTDVVREEKKTFFAFEHTVLEEAVCPTKGVRKRVAHIKSNMVRRRAECLLVDEGVVEDALDC